MCMCKGRIYKVQGNIKNKFQGRIQLLALPKFSLESIVLRFFGVFIIESEQHTHVYQI